MSDIFWSASTPVRFFALTIPCSIKIPELLDIISILSASLALKVISNILKLRPIEMKPIANNKMFNILEPS